VNHEFNGHARDSVDCEKQTGGVNDVFSETKADTAFLFNIMMDRSVAFFQL